jgi:replicative DNA helicase Mcm
MFGGVHKNRDRGVKSRGDIHVLLIGDPGSGKSQMLKRISTIAPKARFVSGKGASGAGLTASVVKDEFLKGWALEAGALVLANRGICCIDELDKMTKDDTSAMHEALEQQTVTISKANIQATLRSETTVLAAANPKFGRFDPYEIISKQIELPPTLLNRFDLIFPVRDMPDKTKDEKLASFLLNIHKEEGGQEGIISPEKMKKYIAYARQNCRPKLTEAAMTEIKEYYVKMRGGDEGGQQVIKAVPISARQLEALVRLSEAAAKLRLSEKVTKRDAQTAIELVHFCLQQIGMDPDTGKIDIDRITTGISASQRSHLSMVKEIIMEMEKEMGKTIPIDDVVREAGIKGIADDTTHEVIEKLKRAGDLFSPKHGFIQRL